MTEIYVFLSTSFLWLSLWALREFERRRRFDAISGQTDLLRGEAETWRGIAEAKERQVALAQDALRRAKAGKIFELGVKAPLPASAGNSNGQQSITHSLERVTTGLPRIGGPDFSGRQQ